MHEADELDEHEERTTRDKINATAGVLGDEAPLQSCVEGTRPGDRTLGRAALSEIMSYCSSANIGGGVG